MAADGAHRQPQSGSEASRAVKPGGFFVADDAPNKVRVSAQKPLQVPAQPKPTTEDTYVFPLEDNEMCDECGSIELDTVLKRDFDVRICSACRSRRADDYVLLTKSTAREEFMLTDEELRDTAVLPFVTRPNPHKSTWTDMQLYLRLHVKRFAHRKWGGPEGLAAEIKRRADTRDKNRERRFAEKLGELRRKTRSTAVARATTGLSASRHEHVYGPPSSDGRRKCTVCGICVIVEEL